MKNLKKVLALVVAFSMMLCSVALAAFPDVEEGADYEVAVNTLAALGIISGDDQGNFNPDNSITRAEFTKIVCEIQGLKGDANKGATPFTDVAADHWASGYINMATNLKIINGMGDGTFAPEAPVTYEQAIKMLVVTLGYAPMAADRGGYPTGHLVVAQTYGMTKNITAPAQAEAAKRSLIAQIVYNTIDTPMMEQTGFGSNITYEVKDGNNDRERTTLLTSKFDVAKLGGVVVANEKIALLDGAADKGQIALKYDNNYKSTNDAFELSGRGDYDYLNNVEIGETNADELLGLRVIAYVRDNGNEDYEVIAIVPEEGKNASITIALTDIDSGERTVVEGENLKLAYYKDADATKSTQLKIEEEYTVIWNDQASELTLEDFAEMADEAEVSATLELVDWDGNGKYDLIKGSELAHFVVAEVDAEDFEIKVVDSNEKFYLEADEVDYTITIKNAKGEALSFEDIKVGDVIAVVSDGESIDEPETFIEIIVLGDSSVTGIVKATRDGEVKVDTTWYDIDAAYEGKTLTLGSEGTFYIGSNGKIVAFDGTKAVSGNYGIIVKTLAVEDGGWDDDGYQVKVLDAKGQVVIYDVAEKVKLRNNTDEDLDPITVKLADEESVIPADFFANTVFADLDYEGATLEELLANFEEAEVADEAKAGRVIQFKTNSSNEITEIAPAYGATEESDKYDADDLDIGSIVMDSATVIFNVKNDIEDGKVVTIESLLNDADYTVVGFAEDEDTETFGAVIILDGGASLTTTVEGWAVVTAKSEVSDEDDATAYEIEIVENGSKEAKTILVTEDTVLDADYNDDESAIDLVADEDFDIGSIILYAATAEGEVETLAVLANIVDDSFAEVADLTVKAEDSEYETTFAYGKILDEADTSFEIADVISEGNVEVKVKSAANEYRYGYTGRKTVVTVGSYNGGDVEGVEDEEDEDTNYVFVRFVSGKVADIISIDVPVAID